ncbi:PREDICTED: protein smoothened isoform X1 [Polistes dominula]|uniref:Protein smoothened n=2 Tax=Polistes dominula TaxID=743375 RepID=A0ABM1I0J9_POLDO|nr:PREDICTED: protein smoothened isoform X1 [Polistes dominula]XP_015173736.1 PREDICTED: protein smoothened isoform X1 [Polistes dominula]
MCKIMIALLCYLFILHVVNSELVDNFTGNSNGENETWKNLDLSPRHMIKDSNYLLDRYPLGELPSDFENCRRPAKCVPLQNNTCMGTRLPYSSTTSDLASEYKTPKLIEEKLYLLQALRHIPKCWAVVQPFLCSIFMPKCINGTVDLPSQEMCKMVSTPCRIVFNHTIWPSFIKCENTKLFPKSCKNDIRELKFNTSGKCLKPLIPTDNMLAIFDGVDGCGTQCNDPFFTSDEQKQIHSFIAWAAGICCAFNFFTVVTFLIDWRSANKYPALVIFYINCCFMVSCIGWLVQFTPGSRDVIVCRKDGTLRMSEPSGENLSCVVVFVLIYYSLMAAMVWFVILTYAWHMSFQALGKIQDRIDKKGAYFHLIAWCLPLVLTVTIMALGEIDGNSVTGICFVGYSNHTVRAWFLLGPLVIVLLVGGYFLSRGLITLIRLKISSQEIISERASSKIRETIVRMGLFSIFTFAAVIVTCYCHIHEFQHSWEWRKSFRDYMICSITTKYADISECKMKARPSVAKLQLHLFSPFFAGVLMSSWVWTGSTVHTWSRFIRRTFNSETEEPIKLKKHKVIAQAFAKRKTFNSAGRLSISFHNTHEDPVGLNFDLNSVASQDFSSTWAAALPKLVTRRGALVGGNTGSVSSNRRNSVDSEISFSVRRVSVESRRNSLDSQISVQIAELKTTRKVAGSARGRRVKRRRDFAKSRSSKVGPLFRRGSSTSQESQLGAQILSALTIGGTSKAPIQVPNMKRRSASAGLDERVLNSKMLEWKSPPGMLLPFLFPNQSGSDENLSSEEKRHRDMRDKDIDIEAGNVDKDDQDTDSDDSQPDEETKMLGMEEPIENSKSKMNNKSGKNYCHESDIRIREGRKSKYLLQDEAILKHLLQESSETKLKCESEKKDTYKKAGMGDLASSLKSCCPELTRIMDKSDGQINAREIATQTSLPLDILEMEELKQSIDEIINSRHCSSKATQM